MFINIGQGSSPPDRRGRGIPPEADLQDPVLPADHGLAENELGPPEVLSINEIVEFEKFRNRLRNRL